MYPPESLNPDGLEVGCTTGEYRTTALATGVWYIYTSNVIYVRKQCFIP